MKKIFVVLPIVSSLILSNGIFVKASTEENPNEDYYAEENVIYDVDESIAVNDMYVDKLNTFIDNFIKENNLVDLDNMNENQSIVFSEGVEKIKDQYLRSEVIEDTSSVKAADYSGQLFLETISQTGPIIHGHAGIGDGTYVVEALNIKEGVRRQSAETRIKVHFKKKKGKLYDVKYSGKPKLANKKAGQWAAKQVGKGYDFDKSSDKGYFCSELVNKAWGRGAGKYLVTIIKYESPSDLMYSGLTYFVKNF